MTEPHAIPVVVALLLRDGSVLMGERRPGKIYPLHWEFPGGKVEPGESLFAALQRELREELSIEIDSAEEWYREVATYSNGMTYDIHYFLVRAFEGEIYDTEFNQVMWVTREILPTLTHLTGNRNILARIAQEGIPA